MHQQIYDYLQSLKLSRYISLYYICFQKHLKMGLYFFEAGYKKCKSFLLVKSQVLTQMKMLDNLQVEIRMHVT